MLFLDKKYIPPVALELLRHLQSDKTLDDFFLVGGTALALQLGHRLSIDLDFFNQKPFDTQLLISHLSSNYNFRANSISTNTILGFIGETKIDFLSHQYPLVNDLIQADGFRFGSLEDISAMKLNAIVHSGQRLKDYWDIYFLLEKMPLSRMLESYQTKYPASSPIIALKALSYFDDINQALHKPMLLRKINLSQLKKRILQAVDQPDHVFKL